MVEYTKLLYHYSDKKFDSFNLNLFGGKSYTRTEKRVCDVPRIFFYCQAKVKEFNVPDDYCYVCTIDNKAVYDIRKDEYGLRSRSTNVYELIELISDAGFDGMVYNQRVSKSVVGEVVTLFSTINLRILKIQKHEGAN